MTGLSLKTRVCKLINIVASSDTSSKQEMLFSMRLSSVRLGNCMSAGHGMLAILLCPMFK